MVGLYIVIALLVMAIIGLIVKGRSDTSLLDVVEMPNYEEYTIEDKLKINYFNSIAKLVYYMEEDSTEGVYIMDKKNTLLAYAHDDLVIKLVKQQQVQGVK